MICIALYKGVSPISRLIRWQTRSVYSHAAFYDFRTGLIFEAWSKGGVQGWIDPAKHHTPGTEIDFFRLRQDLTPDEVRTLDLYLATQQGKPYDYLGVLRFLTRTAPRRPDSAWFCSELVYQALLIVGRTLFVRVDPYKIAPAHLAWSPELILTGFTTLPRPPITPATGLAPKPVSTHGKPVSTVLHNGSAVLHNHPAPTPTPTPAPLEP
jgi:hypothetical protein